MADLTPIQGIDQVLLFRLLDEAGQKGATKMAFQTEHSVEASRDSDSTATKDGPAGTTSNLEEEVPFTALLARGDETYDLLDRAMYNGLVLELWEVDRGDKNDEGEYKATYRQGKLSELTKTANAEDLIEVECTFVTNGIKQEGYTPLTEEQEAVVQYAFRDTEVYTGREETI